MATTRTARQIGPAPYIVYDHLPQGCFAFEVANNECEPLVHRGEYAVIDPNDREPEIGSLFLRRFQSSDRLAIVEMVRSPFMELAPTPRGSVLLVSHRRPRSVEERTAWLEAGEMGGWADGPFKIDGPLAAYLGTTIIGKVIGLLTVEGGPGVDAKPIEARPTAFSHPHEFALILL